MEPGSSFSLVKPPAMTLLLLLLYLLRVVESNQQVRGFLGESVTLSSAANVTSQRIVSIKWHILSNDSWIATYIRGEPAVDHFWQYRGRLHLDTSSGDLMINNLIEVDAMPYVVEMRFEGNKEHIHKVDLSVAKRLARPTATALFSVLGNGSCFSALQCSSPDSAHGNFTWSVEPPATTYWTAGKRFYAHHSAVILASMGPDREVRFTCNATNALESATDTLAVTCHDPSPSSPSSAPETSDFGHGVLLGSSLGVIFVIITYILRAQIEIAIKYLTDKLCPSNKLRGRMRTALHDSPA